MLYIILIKDIYMSKRKIFLNSNNKINQNFKLFRTKNIMAELLEIDAI